MHACLCVSEGFSNILHPRRGGERRGNLDEVKDTSIVGHEGGRWASAEGKVCRIEGEGYTARRQMRFVLQIVHAKSKGGLCCRSCTPKAKQTCSRSLTQGSCRCSRSLTNCLGPDVHTCISVQHACPQCAHQRARARAHTQSTQRERRAHTQRHAPAISVPPMIIILFCACNVCVCVCVCVCTCARARKRDDPATDTGVGIYGLYTSAYCIRQRG